MLKDRKLYRIQRTEVNNLSSQQQQQQQHLSVNSEGAACLCGQSCIPATAQSDTIVFTTHSFRRHPFITLLYNNGTAPYENCTTSVSIHLDKFSGIQGRSRSCFGCLHRIVHKHQTFRKNILPPWSV